MTESHPEAKFKISLLIPSRGQVNTAFAIALRNLEMPPFTQLQTLYITGCFIDAMRNQLVERAVGDWLLFMDDDLLPAPNALNKLIMQDKDIITGLYFSKQPPHFPQIYRRNHKTKLHDSIWQWEHGGAFEIDACGTGFLLIKKSVFEQLKKPYFKYVVDEQGLRVKGEDLYFCEQAKQAGFEIWCDPAVVPAHVGQTFIGPEYWAASADKLNEMKAKMTEAEWQDFLNQTKN